MIMMINHGVFSSFQAIPSQEDRLNDNAVLAAEVDGPDGATWEMVTTSEPPRSCSPFLLQFGIYHF